MKLSRRGLISVVSALAATSIVFAAPARAADSKEIVYLTPGLDLPFWRYLSKGIEAEAKKAGYSYTALDSHNSAETQLKNAQDAIARGVAGIAISPTDSSTAPSVLALAARAKIPVVVADIGTNSGEYVSFVISDNYQGAHGVGEALAAALKEKGWTDGSVGIVTISQARKNGQARTAGFRDAMKTAGITKEAGLQQMQSYTADETFKFTQDMLTANPDMKAMFIQTDQPSLGALRAIKAGHRDGTLLVAAFDGIPEFVDLLKKGDIVASGMQQPYLMGVKSGEALAAALKRQDAREADHGSDRRRHEQEHRTDPADHQRDRVRQRNPITKRAGASAPASLMIETMTDPATPLLEARAISKSFAQTRALVGANLTLRPGVTHALLGANGAGKSTLSRVISGQVKRDGGEILYRGQKARGPLSPRSARRRHRHGHAGDEPRAGSLGFGEHFPPRPWPTGQAIAPDNAPAGERDSCRSRAGARGLVGRRGGRPLSCATPTGRDC